MTPTLPLREWLSPDRPDDMPVAWLGDCTWTVAHLRHDVALLTVKLRQHDGSRWALCFENSYLFIVALLATLSAGKTPVIPGHCRLSQLEEQRNLFQGVLSDKPLGWQGASIVVASANSNTPPDAPLPGIDAELVVELFTSGSTGRPKQVVKSVAVLEHEAELLAARFAERLKGCRVVASVVPQHLYGLTFRIVLPMTLGLPLHAAMLYYPEQLAALSHQHRYFFVSSPAFLKRLDPNLTPPPVAMVLSAGGLLPWKDVGDAQAWFGLSPDEIYGSTETGVLAWRHRQQDDTPWLPFPGVNITAEEGVFRACSPLIADKSGLLLDDILHFNDDGRFQLSGRRGRVVKIEEKRISLSEIELRLMALDGICDAAALQITRSGRQCIGVLVVLDDTSYQMWRDGNGKAMEMAWRRALASWLEPVAIPRSWRIINEIPVNSMNKRVYAQLQELFNETP
jgi:acyl-coenzyme A synthetase/AMP-(fatty) acid ligase